MKTKKQYSKPQLTQIRLAMQNPVLLNCASTNDLSPVEPCNSPTASCPQE